MLQYDACPQGPLLPAARESLMGGSYVPNPAITPSQLPSALRSLWTCRSVCVSLPAPFSPRRLGAHARLD